MKRLIFSLKIYFFLNKSSSLYMFYCWIIKRQPKTIQENCYAYVIMDFFTQQPHISILYIFLSFSVCKWFWFHSIAIPGINVSKESWKGVKYKKDTYRRTNVCAKHLTQHFMFYIAELDVVSSWNTIICHSISGGSAMDKYLKQ